MEPLPLSVLPSKTELPKKLRSIDHIGGIGHKRQVQLSLDA